MDLNLILGIIGCALLLGITYYKVNKRNKAEKMDEAEDKKTDE